MQEKLELLKSGASVRERISSLAAQISADYSGIVTEEDPLLVLCTLCGAVFFAADLVRALTIPVEINFIKLHSYNGTDSSGAPVLDLGGALNVQGRQILIVEDIVDTGHTMKKALSQFEKGGAVAVRICTLLDKPARRVPECKRIVPDYIGFSIPDLFVVGWGLDCDGKYRLLPDIMVYYPEEKGS